MTRAILAGVLCALALPALAQVPAPVRAALARAGIPADAVSLVVERADGGRPLATHRAREAMSPASTLKLVTTYAALDLLGPAYTFKTDVLATGTVQGGVLEGDLVLRGGGDPGLTYGKLWQLMLQLRSHGIREVHGDVILDRGFFAPTAHDPAAFDNEPRRAYNVGPDALLLNFAAVEFHFVPEGDTVRVYAEPDLPNVEVQSAVAAVAGDCESWRRELRQEVIDHGMLATVVFSGRMPASCGERAWSLAVLPPAAFDESVFRWLWSATGGKLSGRIREGSTPVDARLVMRRESPPLAALARDMNKFSNNVMARNLFLALSTTGGAPGEAAASERILLDWLRSRHIDPAGIVIDNGSGLSRVARISAAQFAALLRDAWLSAVMPEFISSMPIYGVDGTLKNRRATGALGEAHLKGGTLNGVQSVAGYVVDRSGARWVVVMMVNDPRAGAAQPALDALVDWVHGQDRKRGAP